jgi:hypothetical protein
MARIRAIPKSKDPSEHLPIRYRIEIYEETFYNDPTVSLYSSTPFLSISVGDYLEPRTWEVEPNTPPEDDEVLQVKAVQHLLWKIDGSHVGHSLSVCVVRVPKPEDIF